MFVLWFHLLLFVMKSHIHVTTLVTSILFDQTYHMHYTLIFNDKMIYVHGSLPILLYNKNMANHTFTLATVVNTRQ